MSDERQPQPEPSSQLSPGWYDDVAAPGTQRWWTGEEWTDHTRPAPQLAPPVEDVAESPTESDPTPPTSESGVGDPSPSRPKWFVPAVAAAIAVVVIAAGATLAITISGAVADAQRESAEKAAAAAAEAEEAAKRELLPDAVAACRLPASTAQDNGTSAFLDNEGDDYASGDLSISDVLCVLNRINTPDAVINHMSNTRSLDGTQSDTWGDFSATWTYHPDDGLDIIVKLVD